MIFKFRYVLVCCLLIQVIFILFLKFRMTMLAVIKASDRTSHVKRSADSMPNDSWLSLLEIYKPYLNWTSNNNRVNDTKASISRAKLYIGECDNTIILTTRNQYGNMKKSGGDWWTVLVKNSDTSIAVYMKDENNGSYTGRFVTPLPGEYVIEIVLDTTNWDGIKDPPKDWYTTGTVNGRGHTTGLGRINHLKRENLETLRFKVNPQQVQLSRQCYSDTLRKRSLNLQVGYWYKNSYRTYFVEKKQSITKPKSNLRKLETLLVYGDSLQMNLWNSLKQHAICKELFKHCINHYGWVYEMTPEKRKNDFHDHKDFDEKKFFHEMREALQRETALSSKSVVVINFGLHFVKTLPLERCMKLFEMFIDFIKTLEMEFGEKCPKFIWKETTPPMVERSKFWDKTDFRFLTKQRVSFWNTFTSAVVEQEANISLLHVHRMALSYPNKTVDHVHYDKKAFRSIEKALYEYVKKTFSE